MTVPVSIFSGGSNNEDPISREPGVEIREDGYVGFVALTADRPSGVRTRTVYADRVQHSHDAAMDDANWLVTQINPDNYV